MRKVLITGATGFIGRNLAEYFACQPNFEVYGTYFSSPPLDHPNIRMLHANLTEKMDVFRVVKGKDIVIQAAAITSGIKHVSQNPHSIIADNAIMNSLILSSCYDHHISHVLFPSCTVMYHSSNKPLKETDFDANKEIYPNYFGGAWNKIYFEKMCEFYNVGYGRSISIKNLVREIIKCSGKELEIEHDLSKPSNKTTVSLDCLKAKMDLGWQPKMSLEKGIRHTLKWYEKHAK